MSNEILLLLKEEERELINSAAKVLTIRPGTFVRISSIKYAREIVKENKGVTNDTK